MRTTPILCFAFALGLASAGLKADAPAAATAMVPTTAPTTAPTAAPAMVSTTVSSVAPALVPTVSQTMDQPMVPTAAPFLSGRPITVTLKDGQKADLFMKSYDNFFFTAFNVKGTRFDIPWTDVAAVDGSGDDSDLAMMRGKITYGPATSDFVVEPRLPGKALAEALWPGILVHGWGFRYAGDNASFYDLAGAEAFGVVLAGFGAYELAYPNTEDTSKTASQDVVIAGAAVFVVSWLWDICFSPGAASALDQSKGLSLAPSPRGAQLAYRF